MGERKNCRQCRFLQYMDEGWEMPEIHWWECRARPGMSNMKSFPFESTKCSSFRALLTAAEREEGKSK